jgi:hypothetical protein
MVSIEIYKTKSPPFAELSANRGNPGPIISARHEIFPDIPSLETPLSIGIMSISKITVIFQSNIIFSNNKNHLGYSPLLWREVGVA